MGPNDPFASPELQDEGPTRREPGAVARSPSSPVVLGFGVGVAFGLLALLTSVPQALAVLAFGALGALVGLAIGSLRHLSLDFREAWRALVGGPELLDQPADRSHP